MNKKLASTGSLLNKNLTNVEKLTLDTLEVKTNLTIPVYTDPETPQNPVDGTLYIKQTLDNNGVPDKYEMMYYVDGAWV